jgi:hypothetical protein
MQQLKWLTELGRGTNDKNNVVREPTVRTNIVKHITPMIKKIWRTVLPVATLRKIPKSAKQNLNGHTHRNLTTIYVAKEIPSLKKGSKITYF